MPVEEVMPRSCVRRSSPSRWIGRCRILTGGELMVRSNARAQLPADAEEPVAERRDEDGEERGGREQAHLLGELDQQRRGGHAVGRLALRGWRRRGQRQLHGSVRRRLFGSETAADLSEASGRQGNPERQEAEQSVRHRRSRVRGGLPRGL